jgi:hypothetical protein
VKMGIHTLHADAYHADAVAEQPSLSASIAHRICSQSPAHARAAHPRLNPSLIREESDRFDLGNVAHAILLEGQAAVEVIDAPDWRTKDARERRDAARAVGKVPLLAHVLVEVDAMVAAVAEQLANHAAQPPLFTDGKAEQTLIWEEPGGVVCRARLDWLRDDRATIDDLKTTSRSASPEAYSRNLFGVGGDVQAAFYARGVQELTGETPEFRWATVETSAPYALAVIAPGPDVLALGHSKVEHAIRVWRECLATDIWPGYPQQICWANAPDYEVARWLDRVALEEAA